MGKTESNKTHFFIRNIGITILFIILLSNIASASYYNLVTVSPNYKDAQGNSKIVAGTPVSITIKIYPPESGELNVFTPDNLWFTVTTSDNLIHVTPLKPKESGSGVKISDGDPSAGIPAVIELTNIVYKSSSTEWVGAKFWGKSCGRYPKYPYFMGNEYGIRVYDPTGKNYVPEFPSIVAPMVAVLGLVTVFGRKKNK